MGIPETQIQALFLDLGGVMLTNGWDSDIRRAAALKFNIDLVDMDSRHRITFDTYEIGKLTLQEYLSDLARGWVTVIIGAIFVACVLTFRRGIVGELHAAATHLKFHKKS